MSKASRELAERMPLTVEFLKQFGSGRVKEGDALDAEIIACIIALEERVAVLEMRLDRVKKRK